MKPHDEVPEEQPTLQPSDSTEPAAEEAQPAAPKKAYRPWLGRTDRYLIRTFLSTYILSIALILSIAVVFDVNDKITDFR